MSILKKTGFEKLKFQNFEEFLIYSLFVAQFVSISLAQILSVFTFFYIIISRRFSFDGVLRWGLALYLVATFLGTTLFHQSMLIKGLGEVVMPFIYFWKIRKFPEKLPYLFVPVGIVCFLVWAVKYAVSGEHKVFWGGIFRVSEAFTILSLANLLLGFLLFEKDRKKSFLITALGVLLFIPVLITARRSFLFSSAVVGGIIIFALARLKFLNLKKAVFAFAVSMAVISASSVYLFLKDPRFEPIRKALKGENVSIKEALNRFSSARYTYLLEALSVIKSDLEEKKVLNLLVGHGPRAGAYLPHPITKVKNVPPYLQRYESIIFVSEIVERGILGLLGILLMWFNATFFFFKVERKDKIVFLTLAIPIVAHFYGVIFRPFWNPVLPVYLVLFRIAENTLLTDKKGKHYMK